MPALAILASIGLAGTSGAVPADGAGPGVGAEGPVPEAGGAAAEGEYATIPLYADGLELGADGHPRSVPVGAPAAPPPVTQDLWLAAGDLPGPARYADLAEQALRDLDALVLPGGAAVAGLTEGWHYVWPRDASFAAAALAATGHADDAYEVLRHLQALQRDDDPDPVFQARYLPDGSGEVPDDRGPQLDGSGWVLWAVARWYDAASASEAVGRAGSSGSSPGDPKGHPRADATGATRATRGVADADLLLARLRPLVVRCIAAIRANVGPDGLPAVFPDYWEVREEEPTLGTAAALLLGLRAVGPVLDRIGEAPVDDLVEALDGAVTAEFGPTYGRHPGRGDHDTSVAFLMPPFAVATPQVQSAWSAAAESMGRPAGGLAPGSGWRQDGVSWTPTTAMFALTAAASGERVQALGWLDWLDAHRTDLGALPEKVLWDGSPSAVAPLAWTCALVLLTLDVLDDPVITGPTPL